MKRLGWLLMNVYLAYGSMAQIVVSGRVVEATSGEALVAASVAVVAQNKGTATDTNGEFTLTLSQADTLVFSFIGYETQRRFVNKSDNYLIELIPQATVYAPLLVQAQRLGTSYTSPNIANIGVTALQLDNQTNLAPVLNRVAGVLMHTGTFSTNRITIRGIGNRSPFGTNKIRAYWNDIPLTNGVGETALEDVDWEVFDEIDVLRGSTSGLYGAGLGGLIHLKSNIPSNNQWAVSNTSGSFGLQRNTVKLQMKATEQFYFTLGLNRTHSDGYRANNEYDRLGIYGQGIFNFPKVRLSSVINYVDLKAFIPSSLNFADYQNEPQKAAFIWANVKGFEDYQKTLVGVTAEFTINSSLKNTSSLFGNYYLSYESRPFNILVDTSQLSGARTTFEWNPNAKFQIKLGSEAFVESYHWQTYVTNNGIQGNLSSDNQENRSQVNVFAQGILQLSRHWSFQAGLSYNYTHYRLEDQFPQDSVDRSGDYGFEPILSPYLSTTYTLHRHDNTYKWYGIWSYGFSSPTLEETLTPSGAINPDIQPERCWNYELGTSGSTKYLTWLLAVYTMRIRDLLVARRTDFDQFIGINAGKTTHNGLELELNANLSCKNSTFQPFVNYTYSDYVFNDFQDGNNNYSDNALTGTPPHLLTSGLIWTWKGIYGNINYQFVDAMPIRDDNSLYSEAYDLLNARLGYSTFISKHWGIEIFAGVNNISNEKYASMLLINANSTGAAQPRYYYPGLPLNYYGSLKVLYRW